MQTPRAMRQGTSGDVWEKIARAGYAVSGALHIVLGVLIARVALGSNEEASSGEALSTLGETTFGAATLWAAVIALGALATWRFADALRPHDDAQDRVKALAQAIVYVGLAILAGSAALGASSGGDDRAQGVVSTVLDWPGGQALVGATAAGILIAGVVHIVNGARSTFMERLKALPPKGEPIMRRLGMAGYIAKGIALIVVGLLFGSAAINADSEDAAGLDGALKSLLDLPGGAIIVVIVGLGFAAYGLHSLVRARYARM